MLQVGQRTTESTTDEYADRRRGGHKIRWQQGELLGAGAYGKVYLGLDLDNGQLLAVKQMVFGGAFDRNTNLAEQLASLAREIQLLEPLDHENIVRYYGMDRTETQLNIFLELVPGGSIASLLSKFGPFNENVIRMYTQQILLGLEYLHNNRIIHRDVKGANILVDSNGNCKLTDFGASTQLASMMTVSGAGDEGAHSLKGTPYWMAPEVIKETGHGRQADIWSIGCTVIEMATGKPPWSQFKTQVSALYHIAASTETPELPAGLSTEALDFLRLCLQRNPASRPSASRLLQHDFVRKGFVAPPSVDTPIPEAAELLPEPSAPGRPEQRARTESIGELRPPSPLQFAGIAAGVAPGQRNRYPDELSLDEPGMGSTRMADEVSESSSLRAREYDDVLGGTLDSSRASEVEIRNWLRARRDETDSLTSTLTASMARSSGHSRSKHGKHKSSRSRR